ncbi:MAG TPA: hypothetical protein VI755_12030 [Anaerolineales bacterium]|nr:hypothetical protein [Anaerolineales bacterium]
MPASNQNRSNWGKQWVGAFAGAVVGWALVVVFPALEQKFSLLTVILWCAAIGAALTNLNGFTRAGAALTRRQNNQLNFIVGLGLPVLLLLLITLLLR